MSEDDFAVEPIEGLPELLPKGEVILWQGRPNWLRLTIESLNLWWVCLLYTSPSPRDTEVSRMPSSA